MGRLSGFRYRDITRKLRRFGFVFDRQAAGSHEIWYCAASNRYTTIPNHAGEMPLDHPTSLGLVPIALKPEALADVLVVSSLFIDSPLMRRLRIVRSRAVRGHPEDMFPISSYSDVEASGFSRMERISHLG